MLLLTACLIQCYPFNNRSGVNCSVVSSRGGVFQNLNPPPGVAWYHVTSSPQLLLLYKNFFSAYCCGNETLLAVTIVECKQFPTHGLLVLELLAEFLTDNTSVYRCACLQHLTSHFLPVNVHTYCGH